MSSALPPKRWVGAKAMQRATSVASAGRLSPLWIQADGSRSLVVVVLLVPFLVDIDCKDRRPIIVCACMSS